jgi:hypothetical protein
VRWILCEAAQTAKRSPEFAASYQAIAARRGKKIATTAIARKLVTRAYHLLTDAGHAGRARHHPRRSRARRGDTPARPGGRQAPGKLDKSHEPATPRSMT